MSAFDWYYILTGLLGIAIWVNRRFFPWLKPRLSWYYFKVRFNRLFIGGFLLALIIYGITKIIPYQPLIFITTRIILGFGSLYALLLFIDWLVDASGIQLDKSVAFLAFFGFIYLTVISVKDYMVPDLKTNTQVRVFLLPRNNTEPIFVADYHEHDPFTYRSDGDFLIEIVNDDGKITLQEQLPENTSIGRFYSAAETGKMYIRPIVEAETSKINLAMVHQFRWANLTLRNHWFLRHAIPYSFLVMFLLLFTPKYQYRRLLMSSFSDNLPKELDQNLQKVIFNNPIDVAVHTLQQFFTRVGIAQTRFTAKSAAKLYKEASQFLRAKYDFEALQNFNIVESEYEVQYETNKTKTAEQKWKRQQYEGKKTKWSGAAKEHYQNNAAQELDTKDEIRNEAKRRRGEVNSDYQTGSFSWEEAKIKLEDIDAWEKKELENLESRL